MSRAFATTEEYRAELTSLGEAVCSGISDAVLLERYGAFCADEEASGGIFPAFGALRSALGLEYPEAMCVAAWFYRDCAPLPPLTAVELLEYCRRLGKRSPGQALGRLFVANGENVTLHPLAADFLLEREPRLPEGLELSAPQEADSPHTQALFGELAALLDNYMAAENPFPLAIALCGENGSGRGHLVSRLCLRLEAPTLKIDGRKNPSINDIMLAAELYGAVPCVTHAQSPEQIAGLAARTGFVFVLCDGENPPPENPGYALFPRDMPEPDAGVRAGILAAVLGDKAPKPDLAIENGLRRLNPGQARQLALRLKAESMASGKPVDKELFLRVLRERSPSRIEGAVRLECPGSLRDLALPPDLSRQLAELCAFVKIRGVVYEDWGFAEKVPWGRGISALFYGAPGTGKTMAAAVLANETGLPLLRADISQLMSKYIGETQKNLGKIFEEAAKTNSILFFDEADAIFARRTESSDAQDKYANAETAYLLQRIEVYDGVCVLATNLLQNFDEAFRRRIGYMLHFPLPDAALRERIWRGIFPAGAPLEEPDFGLLAKQLELSGASIKNCALHAAYLAAANKTPITMRYILEGAKNEYQKQGKTISPQMLQMLSA